MDNKEIIKTNISEINCTDVYDERGYIHKDKFMKILREIIKSTIPKI